MCNTAFLTSRQVVFVRIALWVVSWVVNLEAATWDDTIIERMDFFSNSVLQVPFLLMTLMSYITPTLDDMYGFFPVHTTYHRSQHANGYLPGSWNPYDGSIRHTCRNTNLKIRRSCVGFTIPTSYCTREDAGT